MISHDKSTFSKLLENGADPNKCNRVGKNVMNRAALDDDPFWLRTALAYGGDPNAVNRGNRNSPNSTPVFYALNAEQTDNVRILVEAGADVNHQNSHTTSPLRCAAESGNYESVVILLDAGADPLIADRHGYNLRDWFDGRSERHVVDKNQIPWFRKARQMLIERGVIKNPE